MAKWTKYLVMAIIALLVVYATNNIATLKQYFGPKA